VSGHRGGNSLPLEYGREQCADIVYTNNSSANVQDELQLLYGKNASIECETREFVGLVLHSPIT